MNKPLETKSLFVSIVGKPNVGKSSLMNMLVNSKISIVSPKPQTTRGKILGILTFDDTQLVFIDTPGLYKPKNKLDRYMISEINSSFSGAEACMHVIEAGKEVTDFDLELIKKFEKLNIPIYTTARIHEGINRSYCMTEKLHSSVRYLEKNQPMRLKDFVIESFEVPHDGTDNVGYCIEIDGKIFSFLTDLGEITPIAANYIRKANYLILEANYDEEMLKMGTYPLYLKERIASHTGHMSNTDTADFLANNVSEHLKYIWLCHLSKDNNHPELAYKTVDIRLFQEGIRVGKDVSLVALKRTTPSEMYELD